MFSACPSVRFAVTATVTLAALLLAGCPKQEWHYTPPPAPAPSKDFDRDDVIRNYVCRNYKAKNFALPAGTTQQDLEQACKGIK